VFAEKALPKVEVFAGCCVVAEAPNKDVVAAGCCAAEFAAPNKPVEGVEVAVVDPKRPVEGAEVVVAVPNEKVGAEVLAAPPPRLNSPPVEALEVVVGFVLRLGKVNGCDVCWEVEASKMDFRLPCASVVPVFRFRPEKGLLEPEPPCPAGC